MIVVPNMIYVYIRQYLSFSVITQSWEMLALKVYVGDSKKSAKKVYSSEDRTGDLCHSSLT